MSLLLKRSVSQFSPASIRSTANPGIVSIGIRAIHQTPRQHGLRESDTNRDVDLTEEYRQRTSEHKEDHARGEPKWHESLASDSEASIRADKDQFPDPIGKSGRDSGTK